jgi:two-component system, OmpR family, KDP operon response regulator KdpE
MSTQSADRPVVLVIDDEVGIQKLLRLPLIDSGFRVEEALTGRQGLVSLAGRAPDLMLLDLGLPDMDGLEVLKEMRGWSKVPVIILSARGQDRDKVSGLDLGADDYLTKPFSVQELLARVRAAMRRGRGGEKPEPAMFESNGLSVDLPGRNVKVDGREVKLTPIEFRLLTLCIRHIGRVLTYGFILREVWGPGREDDHHALRVHMANLRRKIEADPARPKHIQTDQGVGYRFRSEDRV